MYATNSFIGNKSFIFVKAINCRHTFTPTSESIRISISGTSRFALTNLSLDRDNVDTLISRYEVSKGYRYSFQGQEHDDEIKGKGNSVNYQYRMHDTRLGRFFAVDPLSDKYPWNSPYAFSENRVIDGLELEGLEVYLPNATKWDYDEGNNGLNEPITFIGNSFVSAYNGVAGLWNFLGESDEIGGVEGWQRNGNALAKGMENAKFQVESFVNDPSKYLQKLTTDDLENMLGGFLLAKGIGKVVNLPTVRVSANKTPTTYLNKALKRQGLKDTPKRMKESWKEKGYKYEVRLKDAKSEYSRNGTELRVSRQN